MHATGQPDTPVECLVDILERALKAGDNDSMRALVEHAHKLASGLDPYLDAISTPPSQVSSMRLFCSSIRILFPMLSGQRGSSPLRQSQCSMFAYCVAASWHVGVNSSCPSGSQSLRCALSQICQELIQASLRHPWSEEHKQVPPACHTCMCTERWLISVNWYLGASRREDAALNLSTAVEHGAQL